MTDERPMMNGFHLGSCTPNADDAPAGDGCDVNCPRRLHAKIAQLRARLLTDYDLQSLRTRYQAARDSTQLVGHDWRTEYVNDVGALLAEVDSQPSHDW